VCCVHSLVTGPFTSSLINTLDQSKRMVYIYMGALCLGTVRTIKGWLTGKLLTEKNKKLIIAVRSGDVNNVISELYNCPKDPYLSGEIIVNGHMYYQMPVLILAVIGNDIDKVNLLVKDGLDPDFMGDYIYPALVVAALGKQRDIIQALLQAGASVNTEGILGITTLQILAADNDLGSIQLLYLYGYSMDSRGYHKITPLDLATGSWSIEQWLEAQGVNVNELYCVMNGTASHIANNSVYKNLAVWLDINCRIARRIPEQQEMFMPKKIFVFNYILFDNHMDNRDGAEIDSKNIRNTFEKIGYRVKIYENFTYSETNKQLETIRKDRSLCSIILIVLSHGVSRNHFCTSDGKIVDFLSVQRKFNDSNCPSLKGRPKILLGNFCRGKDLELVPDSGSKQYKVPRHMVTIYASQEDIMAMRNPHTGTIFIKSLCSVLKKYSKEKLLDIFDRISEKMIENRGTTLRLEMSPPSIMNFTFHRAT
ncbi:unnamed protein product, partial [Meganyctiphanes norvegica]